MPYNWKKQTTNDPPQINAKYTSRYPWNNEQRCNITYRIVTIKGKDNDEMCPVSPQTRNGSLSRFTANIRIFKIDPSQQDKVRKTIPERIKQTQIENTIGKNMVQKKYLAKFLGHFGDNWHKCKYTTLFASSATKKKRRKLLVHAWNNAKGIRSKGNNATPKQIRLTDHSLRSVAKSEDHDAENIENFAL